MSDLQSEFGGPGNNDDMNLDFGRDFDELSVVSSEKSAFSEKSEVSAYGGSDLSPEESVEKKKKMLFQIKRMEKRGFTVSRHYDMNSSVGEMKAEIDSIKREANLDSGTKMAKQWLVTLCSTLEMGNKKFDPFDVVLDGWSEEINNSVDDGEYDDVMEEMYDKYYDKIQLAPEVRLMMMVGGSAIKFHVTNTMLKAAMPGMDETMLRRNPQMQEEIMNVIKRNDPNMYNQVNEASNMGMPQMRRPQPQQQQMSQPRHEMRPPSFDPDDILNELENEVMDTRVGIKQNKKGQKIMEL
jgi:hypothetical protein